jgi:histidine triad (HIT) family protein
MAGWSTIMSSIILKRLLAPFIGWIFAHMSFALPVQRLKETKNLIAFYHPKPAYPVHILLVPKKSIASLEELSAQDSDFLIDLIQCVQTLVAELNLSAAGYRLVVNGGEFQDFPQLHFHLIAELK